MQNLRVMEIRGIRVLTTQQLADCYGIVRKTIQNNFAYNRERYTEGKHYISVQGDDLKRFKGCHEIQGNLKYTHILYLWTEKGALLHAKSLNTDKAWEVYDYLVDFYFRAKETSAAEEKKEVVPVKVTVSKMEESLPGRKRMDGQIPEMSDPILIFRTFLKIAADRGITVRSCPFETCRSILKGDQIGIRDGLTLREINYELAWELAHAYIHHDGGDLVKSPLAKDYNAQAAKAAEMMIQIMETFASMEKTKTA